MKGPLFDGEDLKMADSNLSPCDLKRREKKIRELKSALRNEEHKLVLMKKIKQSQLQAQQAHLHHPVGQATSQHPTTAHHHAINAHQHHPPPPPSHHTKQLTMAPNDYSSPSLLPSQPPLKAHQATSKPTSRPHIVLNPPINNRSLGRPPPPLGHPSAGHSAPSGHVMHPPPPSHGGSVVRPGYSLSRTPVTTPPNVVLGYHVDNLRAQSLSHPPPANQMKPGRQSEVRFR